MLLLLLVTIKICFGVSEVVGVYDHGKELPPSSKLWDFEASPEKYDWWHGRVREHWNAKQIRMYQRLSTPFWEASERSIGSMWQIRNE